MTKKALSASPYFPYTDIHSRLVPRRHLHKNVLEPLEYLFARISARGRAYTREKYGCVCASVVQSDFESQLAAALMEE